jgi:hypothetical protein
VLQQLLSIIDPTGRSDGYDAFHIGKSRSHPDR